MALQALRKAELRGMVGSLAGQWLMICVGVWLAMGLRESELRNGRGGGGGKEAEDDVEVSQVSVLGWKMEYGRWEITVMSEAY